MTEKPYPDVCCVIITATSCPTDRGDRLRAVRRLMCQLLCHSISMMLQACLLLQHLPLQQEVIHKFFSYIYYFFITFFIRTRRGRVCLYCPHVLGGREACLGGGCSLRCFLCSVGQTHRSAQQNYITLQVFFYHR